MAFAPATIALLVWALIVAVVDARTRRIPNGLLLAAAVPGALVFAVRDAGLLGHSWADSLFGATLPLVLLIPGFLLKALGGGDVKFALCCGWFLGSRDSALMLVGAGLVLGLCAAYSLWVARRTQAGRAPRIAAGPAIAAGFIGGLCARPLFGL